MSIPPQLQQTPIGKRGCGPLKFVCFEENKHNHPQTTPSRVTAGHANPLLGPYLNRKPAISYFKVRFDNSEADHRFSVVQPVRSLGCVSFMLIQFANPGFDICVYRRMTTRLFWTRLGVSGSSVPCLTRLANSSYGEDSMGPVSHRSSGGN